jgi:hypothetical protein
MAERRRHNRLNYATSAAIASPEVAMVGLVRNISPSGLFVELPPQFTPGEPVSIQFRLRHSRHLMDLQGEIAHTTSQGLGIRII